MQPDNKQQDNNWQPEISSQQKGNLLPKDQNGSDQININQNNVNQNNINQYNVNQNNVNQYNTSQYNTSQYNTSQYNESQCNNQFPDKGYPGQMDPNQMQYWNKKPKLQILQDNSELSDFDQLPMHPKKLLSWVFFSLFILAGVVIGASNLIGAIVNIAWPSVADTDWYVWALTFISLVLCGLPIYYLLLKRIPDSPKGKVQPLKLSTFIVLFFICAAVMYITNMFSVMLTYILSLIKGEEVINPLSEVMLNGNFLITMLYAAVVAPIVEEVIFRGLLLNKLRRFGDIPAILLSGLAFGCFHFNLSQFFYAAVLGFIFAYVTLRTNTIWYSILLHVMINFIASAVAPFVADGNIIAALILSVWVFASIIIGLVFLGISFKHIRLERGQRVLKGSSYFLNTGVLLYTAISLAMIIVSTLL